MTEYQRYPHAVVLHKVQWVSRGNNSLLWTWKLIKHYKKANYKIWHYEALNRNILYQTIKRKSTHLKASFKNHINSIEPYQKANCNVLHFKASLEKWPSLPRRFERYCLSSVAIGHWASTLLRSNIWNLLCQTLVKRPKQILAALNSRIWKLVGDIGSLKNWNNKKKL